ncbi:MAG: branched-chain amino acid ABC transporter substrate-binding protein [Alphaproteobacteria bacterium]|nr:branched-chain amino acid ABC transporter substrate-binding protein [Alphaproteobacteria bacterium]
MWLRWSIVAVTCLVGVSAEAGEPVAANPQSVVIGFVTEHQHHTQSASPLDVNADDEGLQGARLALSDNATTGRFTGQAFVLAERVVSDPQSAADAVRQLGDATAFIVADLPSDALQAALGALSDGVTVLNTRVTDDQLRNEGCRGSLLHVAPSRAMTADALAQYLAVKRWNRWLLVIGRHPEDELYSAAIRRAAARFGARIVAERRWTFEAGNPHADTGHVNLQAEVPAATRGPDHDVLIVADEADEFGDSLPYRTAAPRPVAGTEGLIATAWSPVQEQWGALQLQSRFHKQARRAMTSRDYTAWLAVRALGEAALRTQSNDAHTILSFMTGKNFRLAGFKGESMSFRPWDGQLRQPVLIAGPRMLVSVSPQPEFLHEGSNLDSLGFDAADSKCRRP